MKIAISVGFFCLYFGVFKKIQRKNTTLPAKWCKEKARQYKRISVLFSAAEVGLYEQISRLNNHRPFRLPPMRAAPLNFFGTLSVRYELLAPMQPFKWSGACSFCTARYQLVNNGKPRFFHVFGERAGVFLLFSPVFRKNLPKVVVSCQNPAKPI